MKIRARDAISLILFISVLAIAVYEWPRLWNNLYSIKWYWALSGLIFYFVNYLLRALRLKTISEKKLRMWPDALSSACLHGVASYILPLRAGDLTLPVILKSFSNTDLSEGTRILLKARVLDICALGIITLITALFLQVPISSTMRIIWIFAGIGMILFPAVIQFMGKFGKIKLPEKLHNILQSGKFARVNKQEIIQSLSIWMAIGTCLYCTARAIELPLGMGGIWFLITIQLPFQLVPVQGIANAGNHEGGWIAGLTILGFSVSEGLHFALISHSLLLLYVLILGIIPAFVHKTYDLKGSSTKII